MAQQEKNTLYCSFCGKSQHEVRKLIAGPTVFICDECVELCMDIIREENKNTLVKSRDGVPTPQEIMAVLDSYVIGQDSEAPSVEQNHHVHGKTTTPVSRRTSADRWPERSADARASSTPFTMADATTHGGWLHGEELRISEDYNRGATRIVYVDEVDKIAASPTTSITASVRAAGLLKIMEDDTASAPGWSCASVEMADNQHPVHLWRSFCGPGKDHFAAWQRYLHRLRCACHRSR